RGGVQQVDVDQPLDERRDRDEADGHDAVAPAPVALSQSQGEGDGDGAEQIWRGGLAQERAQAINERRGPAPRASAHRPRGSGVSVTLDRPTHIDSLYAPSARAITIC